MGDRKSNLQFGTGTDVNCQSVGPEGPSTLNVGDMRDMVWNITSRRHKNIYSEEYQRQLEFNVESSDEMSQQLDGLSLETEDDFTAAIGSNDVAAQFYQAAKLIKSRRGRKSERDIIYIHDGRYDMHKGLDSLPDKLKAVDDALRLFVTEMKAQNMWQHVTIMSASDFGRTLTSNGVGTDHGWAGNTFVAGGSIKGGNVFNEYSETLVPHSKLDVSNGRGRLIPKYPWENVVSPVAKWMGLADENQIGVFPNLNNFDRSLILEKQELFRR